MAALESNPELHTVPQRPSTKASRRPEEMLDILPVVDTNLSRSLTAETLERARFQI